MSEENEKNEEGSFAELLATAEAPRGRLNPGDRVQAPVVKITSEWIFIDLGEKNEGYLDRKEFTNDQGETTVGPGDSITAYFVKSAHGEKLFTTRISNAAAGRQHLDAAWRGGIPVEATVAKEIKGGYELKLGGQIRGFCPYSQMTLHRADDPAAVVGQSLLFHITEYKEDGKDVILSRRTILEEERQARKEELRAKLRAGDTVKGTVRAIHKFGVFVDLGGIQGFIPASEMAWDRSLGGEEIFAVGQEVAASIVNIDWEQEKITLSVKATAPDPWAMAAERYPVGSTLEGKVSRLAEFGAFITLEPGVDGLIHISKLGRGKKIKHPRDVVREGQAIQVQVEKIEVSQRRISLALPEHQEEDTTAETDKYLAGNKVKTLGTLGDLIQLNKRLPRKK